MLDIYETLEISKILAEIATFSNSEIAKNRILNLKMLSKEEAKNDLEILDEMMSYLLRFPLIPLTTSFDLRPFVEASKKERVLSPIELEHIASDIINANKTYKQFSKVDKTKYLRLFNLANKLYDLSPLEKEIHRVILPSLAISDEASTNLKKIRQQIVKKEQEVRTLSSQLIQKYSEYISESSISIRNGHFVLPIKTTYKNKIDGIIHDFSSSGQTTFIEPSILVNVSNQIYALKADEQEEIYRLLKGLTELVSAKSEEIVSNNEILAEFDYICAKAQYSNNHKCYVSELCDERIIDLKKARHPLIDSNNVVANDFSFDIDNRIIIISGPNAGGKTVALKTLGLMVMMNQMGIAIPVDQKAHLSYFPRIYADIGDNQSLSDNLSTFSAHISNLSTITHFVSNEDLVLLDELGTGTSPLEGSSLALAVTDFLLEKKCFVLISSHFEKMKEYPYRHKAARNALMVFDDKKLEPTYVLKIGYPGRSYGLEVAKRYHLDNKIIEKAKKYVQKSSSSDVNDVLDELNKVLKENEELNKELALKSRQLDIKEKDLKYQTKVLNEKKENLLEDVDDIKQQMILDAKKEIDKLIDLKNNPNQKTSELIAKKHELGKLFNKEDKKEIDETISIGDYVVISSLDIVGRVIGINKNRIEINTSEGHTYKTTLDKVEKTSEPPKRFKSKSNVDEMIKNRANLKSELNIIGEHVDDGIDKLAKYLDDARIRNYKEVRIIHGMGTGALKKAVHEYLSTLPFVEEYHLGGQFDGSSGATIVKLK